MGSVVAMVWTAISHYQEHGHVGLNIGAAALAVGFGAIAFFSGRSWWRGRPPGRGSGGQRARSSESEKNALHRDARRPGAKTGDD